MGGPITLASPLADRLALPGDSSSQIQREAWFAAGAPWAVGSAHRPRVSVWAMCRTGRDCGAEGWIRTRTSISSQPSEDCVSTNFTTSASPIAEAGVEPAAKGL